MNPNAPEKKYARPLESAVNDILSFQGRLVIFIYSSVERMTEFAYLEQQTPL